MLRKFGALGAAAAASLGLVMPSLTASPALAQGSRWAALAPQSPVGLAANELRGVSCWAAGGCFAVGYSATEAGQPALVESLGAGGWALPSLPPGPGTYRNQLDGLSCASASFCVAVGFYQDYARPAEPLIETYSNGSWSVTAGTGPGRGGNFLSGVSCPAVGSCYAVGYYSNERTDELLAETLSGGTWASAPAASAGAGPQQFSAVSCSAVGNCWAVGYYQASTGTDQALAEHLSGGSWALGQAADNGARSNRLAGVSCPPEGSCVAVGTYFNGHAFQTLAESLTGSTWSVAKSPNASVANNSLQAVSCSAAGGCEAVGQYSNGRDEQTLAMSFAASAWHLQTSPDQAGADNDLAAVSCPAIGTCEAVGNYSTAGVPEALTIALSGTAWSTVAAHGQQAPSASLTGVSCPVSGSCLAVGWGASSTGAPQALAEAYDAGTWATSAPEVPPGAEASYLQAVSCPVALVCVAVGYYLASGGTPQALAESYTGGTWQLLSVPLPSTAGSYLEGVSCPAVGTCVAVGYDLGAGKAPQLLAETYSAGAWALSAAPLPAGARASYLLGVSCPAVGTCVAVGSYTFSGTVRTLVEALSGGTWSVPASANKGDGPNALEAVSCPPAGACAAAGYYSLNGNDHPLVESIAAPGAGATLSSLPPGGGYLAGVSCASATACAAVGNRTNGLAHQSLAYVGAGGAWSVAPSYDSSAVVANTLAAVSCTPDLSCVAVGTYQDGSTSLALAERGKASSSGPPSPPTSTTTTVPATPSTTRARPPKPLGTATVLASRPDPSVAGRRVTYTALVRPLPRGGNVTFTDDGVGIAACKAVPLSAKGAASCSVTYRAPGVHVIEALYSGSSGYSSSSSGPYSQVVVAPPPLAQGYWLATKKGTVFAAGAARKLLGLAVARSNPVVSIAAAPDGNGYWVAAANGKVGAFGSARFYGDLPHLKVHVDDIVAITPTPDGRGYWLVGRDGGLFAFGDASYHGSLLSHHVHLADIVGMVPMPRARGYALASATGAVFTFGDARFYGSLPGEGVHLHDIVAVVGFGAGGYMLVGAGGGVFTFGPAAHFYGSLPAEHVRVADIVGAALTPDRRGYFMAGANGAVYGFGDALARPTPPGLLAHLPVVGIAGR